MKEKKTRVRVSFEAPTEFTLRFRNGPKERPVRLGLGLRALTRLSVKRKVGERFARSLPGSRGTFRIGKDDRQRVTVKTYFTEIKDGPSGIKSIRKYARYLAREGTGLDGESVRFLGPGSIESAKEMTVHPNESHYFRVIVSPENSAELNMERFVEEFVNGLERDLGTKLIWNAAIHHNTDTPHAHLLIRGVTDKGATLIIDKAYIKHGMRELGRDVATRFLGRRSELELKAVGERELTAERITGLDRELVDAAKRSPDGLYRVPAVRELKRTFEQSARYRKLARLQYLKEVGLASEVEPGKWSISSEALETLRKLSFMHG